MIIDKFLQVSDNQAVTDSYTASTDVIDFGQAHPNTGMDDRTKMVITVTENVSSQYPNARVGFVIQDSENGVSFEDVVASNYISAFDLRAGKQIVLHMPTRLRRYCRLNYVVNDGPLKSGKFSAQIVVGIQQNDHYPDSPNIA